MERGYCIQIVGLAAKALVVGQPTVGNSTRQCATGQCRNTRLGLALLLI